MLPVYSIISLMSYIYYPQAMIYNTISTAYEAFALCSFFLLLRTYLDPDVRGLKHDLKSRTITYWAWPLSYNVVKRWCRLSPMNGLTWYWCMCFGISQYAILRPLCAILAIILEHFNVYCEITLSPAFGNFYIAVLQSISVGVAMYCVIAFYLELKEEPAIKNKRPLMKLTCIKLVIFLVFWQGILLQLLAIAGAIKDQNDHWSARDIQTGLNALMTCIEMAIFAVLHISAFTYRDYIPEDHTKTTHRWQLIVDAFNFVDFIKEFWRACRWVSVGRKHPDLDNLEYDAEDGIYNHFKMASFEDRKSPVVANFSLPHRSRSVISSEVKPHQRTHVMAGLLMPLSVAVTTDSHRLTEDDSVLAPPRRLRVLHTRSRSNSQLAVPTMARLRSESRERLVDCAAEVSITEGVDGASLVSGNSSHTAAAI